MKEICGRYADGRGAPEENGADGDDDSEERRISRLCLRAGQRGWLEEREKRAVLGLQQLSDVPCNRRRRRKTRVLRQ